MLGKYFAVEVLIHHLEPASDRISQQGGFYGSPVKYRQKIRWKLENNYIKTTQKLLAAKFKTEIQFIKQMHAFLAC